MEAESPARPVKFSPFFRVARLATSANPEARAWTRELAWTNLFKVAPADGGSPSDALRELQRGAAVELFHLEVESLDPKTVLVLTGGDWFQPFQDREGLIFQSPKRNFVKGVTEAAGRRWVVAAYPMFKPQPGSVEEIREALAAQL